MSVNHAHVSTTTHNSMESCCCFPALFSAAHPRDVTARRPFPLVRFCFVSRRSNFFICKERRSFASKQRSRSLERVFRGSAGYCTGLRRGPTRTLPNQGPVLRLTQRKVGSRVALIVLRCLFRHRGATCNTSRAPRLVFNVSNR